MIQPREWRLHLGVHKTATTHLQDTLEAQRDALAADGIAIVPRVASRTLRLDRTACGVGWRGWLPATLRRRRVLADLARLGCDREIVVWSDENLLGWPREMLSPAMFPQLETRLACLAPIIGQAHCRLFLSVRNPATILPSIHAQCLRGGSVPPDLAVLRARWLAEPPSWSGLAERIQAALPGASLAIWPVEAYAIDPLPILARVCGSDSVRDLHLPPPAGTLRPSAEAIAALEALPASGPEHRRRALAGAILAADRGTTPFDPLTGNERSALGRHYRDDLERLRSAGFEVLGRHWDACPDDVVA